MAEKCKACGEIHLPIKVESIADFMAVHCGELSNSSRTWTMTANRLGLAFDEMLCLRRQLAAAQAVNVDLLTACKDVMADAVRDGNQGWLLVTAKSLLKVRDAITLAEKEAGK
jgi:hypothetical protein